MPALGRYAYALTGAVDAGEDLVQDTLVKVSRAWRRVRADEHPLAYARVVMLRTYLSAWRGLLRRPRTVPLAEDVPGRDEYGGVEARDVLRRALARLPRTSGPCWCWDIWTTCPTAAARPRRVRLGRPAARDRFQAGAPALVLLGWWWIVAECRA
jgi:hypothetical protein